MAQLPSRTSVMVRSSRAGRSRSTTALSRLQSCRGDLNTSHADRNVHGEWVSMHISMRKQRRAAPAGRPGALPNPRRARAQKAGGPCRFHARGCVPPSLNEAIQGPVAGVI